MGRHEAVHEGLVDGDDVVDRRRARPLRRAGASVSSKRSETPYYQVRPHYIRYTPTRGNPYHRLVSPTIRVDRATARRFLVRSPSPRPAALVARRARFGQARRRAAGLAPVRPARGHGPEPRPGPGGADRRLSPGVDRRPALRGALAVRGLQQGPVAAADERAPVVPHLVGSRAGRAHQRRVPGARRPRRRAARTGSAATARWHPPISSHARRSTGTGGRPTRSGRCWRRWPRPASSVSFDATATAACTTCPSDSSRLRCSRSVRARTSNAATGCCRASARTACSPRVADRPRSGRARVAWATGPNR